MYADHDELALEELPSPEEAALMVPATRDKYEKFKQLAPAVVESIMDDSEAFQPMARAMAALAAHAVFDDVHTGTIPQRIQFVEAMAKLGGMTPKEKGVAGPAAGSFVINFNSTKPEAFAGLTVDQEM